MSNKEKKKNLSGDITLGAELLAKMASFYDLKLAPGAKVVVEND